ncbi:MAG: antitoxin [Metallibacterium sp.]
MNATAKLFTLANSLAVRIPARLRIDAEEVVISRTEDSALILLPKPCTAAEVFALARAKAADAFQDREHPNKV